MIKIKSMLFFLLLLPAMTSAQKQGKLFTDSLQQELLKATGDTDKINLLNKLSYTYSIINFPEGVRMGKAALSLAEKNKWHKGIGFALYNLGNCYLQTRNSDTALFYFKRASKVNESLHDKVLEARLYLGYGGVYQNELENAKALESYQNALQISEQLPDKSMEGICLSALGSVWNNGFANRLKGLEYDYKALKISEQINDYNLAGSVYMDLGTMYYYFDNNQAIEYYQKAFDKFKLCDSKNQMAMCLSNMGLIKTNLLQFDQALQDHKSALVIYQDQGNISGQGTVLGCIAYVYDNMNNFAKALEYYKKALTLDEETGAKTQVIDDFTGLGGIYNRMQDSDMLKIGERPEDRYRTALDYSNKALALARESGAAAQKSDAWKLLSEVYDRHHDYAKAFDAYKNFIVFRDSNVNMEKNQEITRRDMQFGFDKKQLSDSLINSEEKKAAAFKLERQKKYTYAGIAGIGLFLLLSIVIFKYYQSQKKLNNTLSQTLIELSSTQQQLIKSEKMAAFGLMASRVAHEIQNPLNFVNNFSEISKELVHDIANAKTDEEKKEAISSLTANLEKINHHGKRADNIVKQLQEHTRAGTANEFFEKDKN